MMDAAAGPVKFVDVYINLSRKISSFPFEFEWNTDVLEQDEAMSDGYSWSLV